MKIIYASFVRTKLEYAVLFWRAEWSSGIGVCLSISGFSSIIYVVRSIPTLVLIFD